MSVTPQRIDPQRAQAVTREFDMLKGLLLVPPGIGMVVYGVGFAAESTAAAIVMLFIIGLGFPLVSWWYAKHYGRARTPWRRNVIGAAIALPALVAIFAALGVDHFEQPPVVISLILTAVFLWAGIRLSARRLRMGHADHVVAAVLLVTSLAPLAVGGAGDFPAVSFYFTVTGIGLVFLGVAWHRRLVALVGEPHAS